MNVTGQISKVIVIVIFSLVIFTPPIFFVFQKDRGVSVAENRKLAKKPKLSARIESLLDFPGSYEKYYNDHFGLREFFLGLYIKGKKGFVEITGMNVTDNLLGGRIIEGKDGWLFLNRTRGAPMSDYRNLQMYSQKELWQATLTIAARKYWLEKQGIKYLLFFAPNKHTVYPEYLPDYIGRKGDVSSMDQIYDHLSRYTSVNYVDLRGPLFQNKDRAAVYWKEDKQHARLYWKTDSHWNSAGADIAQYEIARQLERMLPGSIGPRQRAKEDFKITPGRGDLAQLLNDETLFGERVPTIHTGLCSKATHSEYRRRVQTTTCDSATVKALIFHDSFLLGLKPFLADYFSTTLFLWETLSQEGIRVRQQDVNPDLVIEEIAERFLPYVPEIRGELYQEFWEDNYDKWDKAIYVLDRETIHSVENIVFLDDSKHGGADNVAMALNATNEDPQVYIKNIPFEKDKLYMMKVVIESPENTIFQIFYSVLGGGGVFPSAALAETYNLHKGSNTIFIPLFSGNLGDRIRLDPGKMPGLYTFQLLEIRGAEDLSQNGVWL